MKNTMIIDSSHNGKTLFTDVLDGFNAIHALWTERSTANPAGEITFGTDGQLVGSINLSTPQRRLSCPEALAFLHIKVEGIPEGGEVELRFCSGAFGESPIAPGPGYGPIPDAFPDTLPCFHKYTVDPGTTNYRHVIIENDIVYAANGSGMLIFDLEGNQIGSVPNVSAELATYWLVKDGDTIYAGGRKTASYKQGNIMGFVQPIKVVDLENPITYEPIYFRWEEAGTPAPVITCMSLFKQGADTYLALAGNDNNLKESGSIGAGFGVLKVTDPLNMELVGYLPTSDNAKMIPHGVATLDENTVVAATYAAPGERIWIIDVSDPSNPQTRGRANIPAEYQRSFLWGIEAIDTNMVVTASLTEAKKRDEGFLGLHIWNVSNRDKITHISAAAVPGEKLDRTASADTPPNRVKLVRRAGKLFALLNAGAIGVHVFDISDLENPVFVKNSVLTGADLCMCMGMALSADQKTIVLSDGHGRNDTPPPAKGVYFCDLDWGKE